jgi:thiosulfate dehydrogenase [quinone] large subunit
MATGETDVEPGLWSGRTFAESPARYLGRAVVVFLRLFNGLFYFAAGLNKLRQGWLWSDKLRTVFEQRVTELPPDSFGTAFLTHFGIPFYMPTAYVVTILELVSGAFMLLGYRARSGAAIAIGLNIMIGIGGYYDASLIALDLLILPLILTPSGHWFGLDRGFHRRYPDSLWYK